VFIRSQVQFAQVTGQEMTWLDLRKERFEGSYQYIAIDLSPKTMYQFRVSLQYPGAEQPFTWPPDNRFSFETLGKLIFIIMCLESSSEHVGY
jgi:hypothetical protein